MKKLWAVLALGLFTIMSVNASNLAVDVCNYVAADDKKRLRATLKSNKLKLRSVYKSIRCNQDTLLVFADKRGALLTAEYMVGKLPKSVVIEEIPKLNNHHLVEAAKNRVE